jgi:hypothetical protein
MTSLFSVLMAAMFMAVASAAAEASIELAIAVPQRHGDRVLEYSEPSPHFHVILTNTSEKPQRIWREWCSWGYYALSFEVTDAKRKTWTVSKRAREWDKNFPDYWSIKPHECLVLDVQFADTDIWEGFPRPSTVSETFTMRALFQIQPDKKSQEFAVWTGRAISKADKYVFYR